MAGMEVRVSVHVNTILLHQRYLYAERSDKAVILCNGILYKNKKINISNLSADFMIL